MFIVRSVVLAFGALASLFAFAGPDRPLTVLYEQPAAQVVVSKGQAILLEPDLRHLQAVDKNGAKIWRTQSPTPPRGIQALFVHDDVIFYAGNRAHTVSRQGKLGSPIDVPWLSSPERSGCWLNRIAGACAFYCECRFQFASCEDGRSLGAPYRFHSQCLSDPEGSGHSCGCWGERGDLIGSTLGLWLAVVERPAKRGAKRRHYGQLIVAFDPATMKERWRRPAPFSPATYVGVGASSGVFWMADAFGQLAVFDAKQGEVLWRINKVNKAEKHEPQSRIFAVGGGLIWTRPSGASRFELKTGRRIWHRESKEGTYLLPYEAKLKGGLRLKSFGTIERILAKDGASRGRIVLRSKTIEVRALEGGRLLVIDGESLEVIGAGAKVESVAKIPAHASAFVGRTVVAVSSEEALRLFKLEGLLERGRLSGRHSVVAVERALGKGRLWVRSKSVAKLLRVQ